MQRIPSKSGDGLAFSACRPFTNQKSLSAPGYVIFGLWLRTCRVGSSNWSFRDLLTNAPGLAEHLQISFFNSVLIPLFNNSTLPHHSLTWSPIVVPIVGIDLDTKNGHCSLFLNPSPQADPAVLQPWLSPPIRLASHCIKTIRISD